MDEARKVGTLWREKKRKGKERERKRERERERERKREREREEGARERLARNVRSALYYYTATIAREREALSPDRFPRKCVMPLEKENFYGGTRFIWLLAHLTVILVGQRCIDLFVKLYCATLCYIGAIGAMLSTFYFCAEPSRANNLSPNYAHVKAMPHESARGLHARTLARSPGSCCRLFLSPRLTR